MPARSDLALVKRGSARRSGEYCGISLCEWRGSVRALLRSGWYLFANPSAQTRAQRIHAAVVLSAAYLLPASWHREHSGRLGPDHYRWRNAWLAARHPLPAKPGESARSVSSTTPRTVARMPKRGSP